MANSMSQYRQNGVDYIIDDPTVADVFVTTAAYSAGTYVKYGGNLYRFTTDHAAGAWNSSEVSAVKISDEISNLKATLDDNVDLYNAGYIDLPYVNLYNRSKNTYNKAIGSSGTIFDTTNTVITDYIPVALVDDSYYQGIGANSVNIFAAYYDQDKNLLGTLPQSVGMVNMSDMITRTTRFVRFTLNYVQRNDINTFRFYSKQISVLNDLAKMEEKFYSYISNGIVKSPNLLDHSRDTLHYYMDKNGAMSVTDTYYVTDYIPVEHGKNYGILVFVSSSSVYAWRVSGTVCYYDKDKNYISGVSLTASAPSVTPPDECRYLRYSGPYTSKSYIDMIGLVDDMEYYRNINEWIYTPYGTYAKPITITRITEPFVERDWRGYWHFKFGRIYYIEFTGEEQYLQYNSYMTIKYKDRIEAYSPSTMHDILYMIDGEAFVYRFRGKRFEITNTIEDGDIVIFAVEHDVPSGLLFDSYNHNLSFFQEMPIYNTLPISVMSAIDKTLNASGIITSSSANNIFTFVHVSDNHHVGVYIGYQANLTAMAIKHLHSRVKFDAIFNTGDELLTAPQKASGLGSNDSKLALSNAINSYPIDELVFCEGNHDRGIIDEQFISHEEYYNLVLRHWKDNVNVHTSFPNTYYYRDYPKHKIRVICVTTYNMDDSKEDSYPYNDYFGYDQIQMEWLCNDALKVDEGWAVVILVHSAPVTTAEGNSGNGSGGDNPLVLRQILESFKNGTNMHVTHSSTTAEGFFNIDLTTNFESQGARKVIGVFSGHTHIDRIVTINDITYDAICCGYIDVVEYRGNRGTRYANDISAVAFDIGTINLTTGMVNLTRVGFVPTDSTQIRSWSF